MLINVCLLSVLLLVGLAAVAPEACSSGPRRRCRLSRGWRFHRGDVEGASAPGFDDSSWRPVQLPHDWSVEDLPADDLPVEPGTTPVRSGPFSSDSVGAGAVGYTVGGIGWYRRTFEAPASLRGKRVTLLFDGVYMDCEVWVNGTSLGRHPYGYTSFGFDVTPHLLPGESNVIAVRVDASGKTSRWYPGAGIYRHVWLVVTEPLHVGVWGTYVRTAKMNNTITRVDVDTEVRNDADSERRCLLVTRVLDPEGEVVAERASYHPVHPGQAHTFTQRLHIENARCWSVDDPAMYTVQSLVTLGEPPRTMFPTDLEDVPAENIVDAVDTPFGIREISFDADQGFLLNGERVKINGVCIHHDGGCVGAAVPEAVWERRLQLLKQPLSPGLRVSRSLRPLWLSGHGREL